MTTLIPTSGRLLIKKLDRGDITNSSGVLLPGQTLQEETLVYGEIVHGSEIFPTGKKVFYSRYSSTMVVDDAGDQYFIVSDLDIMALNEK